MSAPDEAPSRSLGRSKALLAAAAATAGICAALAATAAPPARAGTGDLRAARSAYPGIVGTALDACSLCHVGETNYRLDAYGRAFDDSRRDFAAIEDLDSDGDGFTNIEEIAALTFPGKADSKPSPSPTPAPVPSPAYLPRGERSG